MKNNAILPLMIALAVSGEAVAGVEFSSTPKPRVRTDIQSVPITSTKPIPTPAPEPVSVLVTRGYLNTNLKRICAELGWKFAPHYTGNLAIPENFTLDLAASARPVSPEFMQSVVHALIDSTSSKGVRPVFHVPDRVVVLVDGVRE